MKIIYHYPTWEDVGPMQDLLVGTSTMLSTYPIGGKDITGKEINGFFFCHSNMYYYDSSVLSGEKETVALYKEADSGWEVKDEKPLLQIICDDGAEVATTTMPAGYNGPNFNEWLFVAGIIVFLISFPFWGQIHFFRKR